MTTLIVKKDDSFMYGDFASLLKQLVARKLPLNSEILYVPDNPLSEAVWYKNVKKLRQFLEAELMEKK